VSLRKATTVAFAKTVLLLPTTDRRRVSRPFLPLSLPHRPLHLPRQDVRTRHPHQIQLPPLHKPTRPSTENSDVTLEPSMPAPITVTPATPENSQSTTQPTRDKPVLTEQPSRTPTFNPTSTKPVTPTTTRLSSPPSSHRSIHKSKVPSTQHFHSSRQTPITKQIPNCVSKFKLQSSEPSLLPSIMQSGTPPLLQSLSPSDDVPTSLPPQIPSDLTSEELTKQKSIEQLRFPTLYPHHSLHKYDAIRNSVRCAVNHSI
jgi:hypothetical protein